MGGREGPRAAGRAYGRGCLTAPTPPYHYPSPFSSGNMLDGAHVAVGGADDDAKAPQGALGEIFALARGLNPPTVEGVTITNR